MSNITITLPDGTKKTHEKGVTGLQVAQGIGAGLAKAALGIVVGGKVQELMTPIEEDAQVAILTYKDQDGKKIAWHTAEHILTQAMLKLYPGKVKMAMGPATEEGFYFDFDSDQTFSTDDFEAIEDEMAQIVKKDLPVHRQEISIADARELFKGNEYKQEWLDEIEQENGKPTVYRTGEEFVDLCKGPHVPSTGRVGVIKLTKVAGAYWRGDAKNKQLQRIYGISFADKKELNQYLHVQEEAKKRDHRVLGQKLNLFSFDDISPGSPFFHGKGTTLYNELQSFIRAEYRKRGYQEVVTPLIYGKDLWQTSGHWDHYGENMFTVKMDGHDAGLKPMNCPSHCVIYQKGFKSYRDLPLRIADFAPLHRNELKGTLGGLTRVRKFSQDDAHIFCTPGQMEQEILDLIDFLDYIYKDVFGFEYRIELSTKPESAIGDAEVWEKAEKALEEALKKKGLQYDINPGDGAFYGPKIDFHIKDVLGRSWQLGTIQADFNLPARFELEYEDKDGTRKQPVMIHRALLGSIERFMAILIEHYAGKFPLWLAPEQVRIVTVADAHNEYAGEVLEQLKEAGIRAEVDHRAESVSKKVREAQVHYVPLILTVGEKEAADKTVAVRTLNGTVKQGVPLKDLIEKAKGMIEDKASTLDF